MLAGMTGSTVNDAPLPLPVIASPGEWAGLVSEMTHHRDYVGQMEIILGGLS